MTEYIEISKDVPAQVGDRITITVRDFDSDAQDLRGFDVVKIERPIPEYQPGDCGNATVRGIAGVWVVRAHPETGCAWLTNKVVHGKIMHDDDDVTDFRMTDSALDLARRQEIDRVTEQREWYRNDAVRLLAELDEAKERAEKEAIQSERRRRELEDVRRSLDVTEHARKEILKHRDGHMEDSHRFRRERNSARAELEDLRFRLAELNVEAIETAIKNAPERSPRAFAEAVRSIVIDTPSTPFIFSEKTQEVNDL